MISTLGPEARPSEYPDASEWEDPPVVADGDPCCELGEPIVVTSRDMGMALAHAAPRIAWGPGRWGLLATRMVSAPDFESDPHAVVFELAADGTPLGPPRVLEPPTNETYAIRWAEGRWAIAVMRAVVSTDVREAEARLFDRDFRPASDWLPMGEGRHSQIDLARLTHGDRWLALLGWSDALGVTGFHDLGVDGVARHEAEIGASVRAVGMRSRVAVLLTQHSSAPGRNEVVLVGGPPEYDMLGRVPLEGRSGDQAAIAGVRDLVVTATIEDAEVRAEVVDPFLPSAVAPARVLGPATGEWTALDAAGSAKHGVAGVCWGSSGGRGADASIDFALVGPDGAPRGRPVRITDAWFRGGMVNCSVGADDDGFLVAWWDGSALWVRRVRMPR